MKISKFHIFNKRIALCMAFFMLFGQFALFHLHIHLDQDKHEENTSSLVISKTTDHANGVLSQHSEHQDCNVCDLYLSKKLQATRTFIALFTGGQHVITTIDFKAIADLHLPLSAVRGPPYPHA